MSSRESHWYQGETEGSSAHTGLDRRSFIKSALAVGGASALASLVSTFGAIDTAAASESIGLPARLNRQHAWDAFEAEARGTTVPPPWHLILCLDLTEEATDESGEPTADARQQVEAALDSIEEHYDWHHSGVLFTVGYSPDYFDRYDEEMPGDLSSRSSSTGLIDPETTIAATQLPHEDPDPDRYDAVMHLASDDARKLLAVEYALWDGEDQSEDLDAQGDDDLSVTLPDFEATFEGVFSKPTDYPDRRVAFAGHDRLGEEFEEALEGTDYEGVADHIPETGATSMGFNPLYENSVPEEDIVTMAEDQTLGDPAPPGVFAQGTVEHVSHMFTKLDLWYGAEDGDKPENTHDQRRKQMLSPMHDEENTGTSGENLGTDTGVDGMAMRESGETDIADKTVEHAKDEGIVGHGQKTARARFDVETRETGDAGTERDDDLTGHEGNQRLEQPVLRRDVPTADDNRPGVHFVGLMRFNGYFHYVRQAMNGTEFDTATFGLTGEDRIQHESVRDEVGDDNGIAPYLITQRRGNYLVPPIAVRALPPARAERPPMTVAGNNKINLNSSGKIAVEVDLSGLDIDASDVDVETVRFGATDVVNRGGGAIPVSTDGDDDTLGFRFEMEATGFDDDDDDLTAGDDDGDDDGVVTARLFAKTDDGYPIRATVESDTGGDSNVGTSSGDRGKGHEKGEDRGEGDEHGNGERGNGKA